MYVCCLKGLIYVPIKLEEDDDDDDDHHHHHYAA
jgi:hypothetical protein